MFNPLSIFRFLFVMLATYFSQVQYNQPTKAMLMKMLTAHIRRNIVSICVNGI
jgi:hypothetical protein